MQAFREYSSTVIVSKKLLSRILWGITLPLPSTYFLKEYYGGKIYLNPKESPMMMDRVLGVYEFWKTKLFFDIVREGMTVVDVGVNKGYFSLLFARLVKDKGKVLSFEPDPTNCFWFRKSIKANKYKCIKLFQHALCDKDGTVTFYRGKKSGGGSLFQSSPTEEKAITVKARKLDNVLKDEGIKKVDVVKIDVQGADLLVLAGAKRTLKRENIRLAMDVDVKNSEERSQLFHLLKSCGFEIFSIDKELTTIEKIDNATKDIYAAKP